MWALWEKCTQKATVTVDKWMLKHTDLFYSVI